ncbi:unnamed protein product [Malus baccata var. baccata]
MKAFSTLLKLKDSDKFVWNEEHQAAFRQIKVSLTSPPVLVPPQRGKPLKLYISAAEESIGCLLAQDNDASREQAIFYLSRNLSHPEINYSAVEKLCLTYVPQKAVKGQALADFLAQHPSPYGFGDIDVEIGMVMTRDNYWTMYFDGSSTSSSAGAGIVIQSPHSDRWYFSLKLDFECTNNQAEYEALIIGLGLLLDFRATRALVLDELAQIASGAQLLGGKLGREIPILRQLYPALVNQQILRPDNVIRTRVMSLPSLLDRQDSIEICAAEAISDDWRKPIM